MKKRVKSSPTSRQTSTTGAVAANLHEGSRAEVLADYLFSGWGTVTPVRRQDDFGIDLYCTLTDRIGQRATVTDYFVVQVKSTPDAWVFNGADSVKWLTQYPQPLFLAWVDKKAGIVRIYHVTPRFLVGSMGLLPNRLELIPETVDEGKFVQWSKSGKFSLSAPILQVSLSDLLNETLMTNLRKVFAEWVRIDRNNCDLVRHGLLRFRMPDAYKVNESPSRSIVEMGNAIPNFSYIEQGILTAAEGAECIGGQLARLGDRAAALFAAFFVDHLQQTYGEVFQGHLRWRNRLPADLGQIVCNGLNKTLRLGKPNTYLYEGIDAIGTMIKEDRRVAAFLNDLNP
jgi:hypothetical protein